MGLYDLAKHCDYGKMKEEIIRDHLVLESVTLCSVIELRIHPRISKKAVHQRGHA